MNADSIHISRKGWKAVMPALAAAAAIWFSGCGGGGDDGAVAGAVETPADTTTPWQADSVVAAGSAASFAIRNDKTLLSWGSNSGGALGRASSANGAPQPIALADVRSVTSGGWYAVSLIGNGDVYAWGWGANVGAAIGSPPGLGSSSFDNPLPVKVAGLANIRAIATRYQHTLALDSNGDVYGFGPEAPGGLGAPVGTAAVRKINGIANVRQVAAGETHSLALMADGTLWAWGGNGVGQLGIANGGQNETTPVMVPGLTDVVAIAASSFASFALRRDGTVWSWGQDFMLGRTGDTATPLPIPSLAPMSSLGAGNYNVFAVDSTGLAFGWGDNAAGRVGVGTTSGSVTVPTPLASGTFTQMTGGEVVGVAVARNGSVYAWGSNAFGGIGGPINGVPRVDTGTPTDTGVTR